MMTILIGCVFAAGVALTAQSLLERRRPSLAHQVLAYVQPSVTRTRSLVAPSHQSRRVQEMAANVLSRLLGDPNGLEERLRRAGSAESSAQFRLHQVVWGLGGSVAGAVCAVVLGMFKDAVRPSTVLVLAAVGLAVGVLARERGLDQAVRRREALMVAEFPAIAEMLALSVAAGEGVAGALSRVVGCSSGPLARELNEVLVKSTLGDGLIHALRDFGSTTKVRPIARFIDAMVIAMERGTPMAEVMRAQACDVRDLGRRELMESAGRKEIAMMVPVVFLVLPITVVFALFPGFFGLSING